MANGVGEAELVAQIALDGDCFFVQFERGVCVAEVAFDATEELERLRQLGLIVGLPGLFHGFGVDSFGVVVTMLTTRLVTLVQERFRGRHDGDRLSLMGSPA